MANELTTTQVADRLGVGKSTVNLWCRQGRFPHARSEETLRGPVWVIPESDLKNFEPPKRGRVPTKTDPVNAKQKAVRRGRRAA